MTQTFRCRLNTHSPLYRLLSWEENHQGSLDDTHTESFKGHMHLNTHLQASVYKYAFIEIDVVLATDQSIHAYADIYPQKDEH